MSDSEIFQVCDTQSVEQLTPDLQRKKDEESVSKNILLHDSDQISTVSRAFYPQIAPDRVEKVQFRLKQFRFFRQTSCQIQIAVKSSFPQLSLFIYSKSSLSVHTSDKCEAVEISGDVMVHYRSFIESAVG